MFEPQNRTLSLRPRRMPLLPVKSSLKKAQAEQVGVMSKSRLPLSGERTL